MTSQYLNLKLSQEYLDLIAYEKSQGSTQDEAVMTANNWIEWMIKKGVN